VTLKEEDEFNVKLAHDLESDRKWTGEADGRERERENAGGKR
jgi:hypothetical protein